ncbi:hypothetical protein L204_101175 [Cryptococcus depauperatus]
MVFPSSVQYSILPRTKRHQRIQHSVPDLEEDNERNLSKREGLDDSVGIPGPIVEFGRPGGATLSKRKGSWKWIWAGEERQNTTWKISNEAECFYPATRLLENIPSHELSFQSVVDSSVKYAEQLCHPFERDGLRDAISDILKEEHNSAGPSGTSKQPAGSKAHHFTGKTSLKDPDQSSIVAEIHNSRGRFTKTWVAFPIGSIGHELNIAPILPTSTARLDRRSRYRFAPTSKPIETFPTPILQICSSAVVSDSRADKDSTSLLVRLQATTHLVSLYPSFSPPAYITSSARAQISYSDTEGRRHVDVVLDPVIWAKALLVDEGGGVWLWLEEKKIQNGRIEKTMSLHKVRDKVTDERDQFFRVAFGTRSGTALVISATEAIIIDIDDPSHPTTTIFSLRSRIRRFLSVEKTAMQRNSKWTLLVTTQEVFWIDERRGVVGLGWKHDYGKVQDLKALILPGLHKGESVTLLHSSTSPLLTALTTPSSHKSLTPFYFLSAPTSLAFSLPKYINPIDLVFLKLHSTRYHPSLLVLSHDGALYSYSLVAPYSDQNAEIEGNKGKIPLMAYWDDDVVSCAKQESKEIGAGEGWQDKASVSWTEIDMRWLIEAITENASRQLGFGTGPRENEDAVEALVAEGFRSIDRRNEADNEGTKGEQAQYTAVKNQELNEQWVDEGDGDSQMDADTQNSYMEDTQERFMEKNKNVGQGSLESKFEAYGPVHGDDHNPIEDGSETGLQYLIPQEFERYLRELDAPIDSFLTLNELARDFLFPLRSFDSFSMIPIHSYSIQSTLKSLQSINFEKHLMGVAVLSDALPSLNQSRPSLLMNYLKPLDLYNSLVTYFPTLSRRDKLATAQLVINLYLSFVISIPEDCLSNQKTVLDRIVDENEKERDHEDDFLRAARALTLGDDSPPPVDIFVVKPFLNAHNTDSHRWEDCDDGRNDQTDIPEEFEKRIQTLTTRALVDDWKLGEDPHQWTWKGVKVGGGCVNQSTHYTRNDHARPIKPLPSSRSHPLFQAQLRSPTSLRSPQTFAHLIPPTLESSYIMPALTTTPGVLPGAEMRSSPPPTNSQMGIEESQATQEGSMAWVSTQIERGKFGGREKKKKGKRRLGGF